MKIPDTEHIKDFPGDIKLGYTEISEGLKPDFLPEPERAEWEAITHPARKNELLTGRYLFRNMLAEYRLDSSFVLKKDTLGKPYAQAGSGRLHVSFSHTRNLIVCALSPEKDLGVDAEWTGRNVSENLFDRILKTDERKKFADENLLKLWTIKEAAAKSLGTGLRTNFNELLLSKKHDDEYVVSYNNEQHFRVRSFMLHEYLVSVAYRE